MSPWSSGMIPPLGGGGHGFDPRWRPIKSWLMWRSG
jgi:hypothetical protein